MRDFAITPSIAVTIGRQTRLYHAYVTTAPAALDSPSTLTLYLSTLADVAGFAANPVTHDARDNGSARAEARLVLVDAGELAWQRARCRGNHHLFAQADPVLVGLTTLQLWLWQRLQAPIEAEAACDTHTRKASE
jgi:hypothetical protein